MDIEYAYEYIFVFSSFEVGKSLVQKLLDLSSCGTAVASMKFVGCPDDELKLILAQVNAHCLSSLQAWCHWISLLVHSNLSKEPAESLVFALVSSATAVFTPAWPLGSEGTEQVYHASLQLLTSVICVIRSHFLWNCSTWNQLFVSVHEIQYLPPNVTRPFDFLVVCFGLTLCQTARRLFDWLISYCFCRFIAS